MTDFPELPARAFAKEDPSPDEAFYSFPRFVAHIDDAAIAAVTGLYRETLPTGGVILDLMGSWISHLPGDGDYRQVIGHGMNSEELAANPVLSRYFVQDLNESQTLPLDSDSVDAATMCVSVQYLQKPVSVFRDVMRVLVPGGGVVVTFSNRCFPTKAVAIWQELSGQEQSALVALYLRRAGFAEVEAREVLPGHGTDPLWAVLGRKSK